MCVGACVCLNMSVSVCLCVCVCARESDREFADLSLWVCSLYQFCRLPLSVGNIVPHKHTFGPFPCGHQSGEIRCTLFFSSLSLLTLIPNQLSSFRRRVY